MHIAPNSLSHILKPGRAPSHPNSKLAEPTLTHCLLSRPNPAKTPGRARPGPPNVRFRRLEPPAFLKFRLDHGQGAPPRPSAPAPTPMRCAVQLSSGPCSAVPLPWPSTAQTNNKPAHTPTHTPPAPTHTTEAHSTPHATPPTARPPTHKPKPRPARETIGILVIGNELT